MSDMGEDYWAGSELAYVCLSDRKRTITFKDAIYHAVHERDVVLEIGTGTGILSLFAIDAGARKVYAVEVEKELEEPLRNTFKGRNIELIIGDGRTVTPPEKVDVIICEMVSTGLLNELQRSVMDHALDYLNPGGRVIPSKMFCFAELVEGNNIFYGYKMPIIQYEYPMEGTKWLERIGYFKKSKALSDTVQYSTHDFTQKEPKQEISKTIEFKIQKNGIVNGIRLTNRTLFPNGQILDATISYCMPMILPTDDIKVKNGDRLSLDLNYSLSKGAKTLDYHVNTIPP